MKNSFILLICLIIFKFSDAQELPNITLKSTDDESVSIQELANTDTIKVFSFWATWCVPCINELDAISEVYDEWQDETDVEIIAISTDDSRTKKRVIPLVNGKGWEYQILLDDNQDLKRALNIAVLPYLIVVKNGEIVYQHTGYTPGSEDALFEVIKKHSN
ncbi:TlpA family protein disulfide reductase [Winogradskyella psychrotolerans]|uniref:TlpA family protein disulfide reductase n=1 Tax=Winogradskyella psychrotolerans TaxID=1344585 RepID=UPI001C07D0D5|nr:TlpA disulfide reductase family protein [Winogradskyella psychrotolerans]MBU2927543.1 TlpA family protein disulfide reductase [Winogradskyella psychrotolerans]